MKILHLMVSGNVGGIEILMRDYSKYSKNENIFVFLWEGGIIADEMQQRGIKVYILNARHEKIFTIFRKIILICGTEKIERVISHHAAPLLKIILVVTKLWHPRIVCLAYAHSNAKDICGIYKKRGLRIRKLIHKIGFLVSDRIIAISQSVKNSLVEYLGIKEEKIVVIYNGVDVSRFRCQREISKKWRLIYVGRLIEEKGVQTTLEALSVLKDKIEFEFVIVGDGNYRKILEEKVREYNLGEKVHFLGNRQDIPALLAEADIFIHMPKWEEGFGITIVEAMAAGLICICGDRGAVSEIIKDNENGFLIENDSQNGLIEKLYEILTFDKQSQYLEKIRQNARVRANDFSMDIFSCKLDNLIS